MPADGKKPVLAGLSIRELKELLSPYPSFRSAQIWQWIVSGAFSFGEMSNLPVPMRRELAEKYELVSGRLVSELHDRDGSIKLGIEEEDGTVIEAVILTDGKDRKTACISTQAGCPMGCVFCKTGSLGFRRNLSAQEISGQFLHLRGREKEISHIVIMGMGEPLLNMGELKKALDFITTKDGLDLSKRRITLSTCGIVNGILDLANNGPDIRLALSLTSARNGLRQRLMPGSHENPLPRLKEALLLHQKKRKRRITLEMVLLGGINTGNEDVTATVDFASGLDVVVNLIPWNPVSGLEFEGRPLKPPAPKEASGFAAALKKAGVKITWRIEKGQSISGACGQLGFLAYNT